ncbi:MAG: LLM class flavin-dependent oxidoreductase [Thermodesulfobacteriota bacterium]
MTEIGLVAPYWNDLKTGELIETARLAEELGYHSIWVPEMWGRDAFSILGLIAVNTKKIKLATGIIPVFSRSPAIIAQTVATLDEISGGRMMLGLGASGPVVIEDWHGVRFEKPLRRTKEYVEIIKMILGGERVDYKGEIFSLKGFRLQFKPLRSNIPILVAAIGPQNIHIAGEVADGWIPFLIPKDSLKEAGKELIEGARSRGREKDKILICPYIAASVSEDEASAKNVVREHIAYYVGGMGIFYLNTVSRYGFADEANGIKTAWENKNKSAAVQAVSERMLDSLSVSGTREHGKSMIVEYINEGADIPVLVFPPKASRALVRETLIALAPGV